MAMSTRKKNRLFTLIIVNLAMMVAITIIVGINSGKVGYAQMKQIYFYNEINQATSERDRQQSYADDIAYNPDARKAYQNTADEADSYVSELLKEREEFQSNTTDPVIHWGAKDGISPVAILVAVAGVLAIVIMWREFILNPKPFRTIVKIQYRIIFGKKSKKRVVRRAR